MFDDFPAEGYGEAMCAASSDTPNGKPDFLGVRVSRELTSFRFGAVESVLCGDHAARKYSWTSWIAVAASRIQLSSIRAEVSNLIYANLPEHLQNALPDGREKAFFPSVNPSHLGGFGRLAS